jgi:hypothetical protein
VLAKAAEGDDPWVLSASTIDISFAITQTGTISLGADGELANALTHTLRLGLGPAPGVPASGKITAGVAHAASGKVKNTQGSWVQVRRQQPHLYQGALPVSKSPPKSQVTASSVSAFPKSLVLG